MLSPFFFLSVHVLCAHRRAADTTKRHRAKDGGDEQRAAARIAQLRALQVEEAARELRADDDLDVKERVKTVLDQMRREGRAGVGGWGGRRPGPRSVGPAGLDAEQQTSGADMAGLMDEVLADVAADFAAAVASPSGLDEEGEE